MRVACIGEAMIELSMTEPPRIGVAGDTLNTAIYLKRAAPGLQVDYITRLGTDPFSAQIRDFIASHDVGTDRIEISGSRIPGLYAITTDHGERSFTYWRGQSAAREMFQTGEAPDFSALDGYDVVYLSAITLAILPAWMRSALLEHLKRGPMLAFDSNYRPKLWASQAEARDCIGQWWQAAQIALPSIDDEMALMGEPAEAVEARFVRMGTEGALKRGAQGPLSLGPASVGDQHYPAAAAVVDTTAAGDSFNGAYLGALLTGQSQQAALLAGHSCAAHVIGHHGAIAPKA
jgi:2-dehydro-3-deoxygluconokinase